MDQRFQQCVQVAVLLLWRPWSRTFGFPARAPVADAPEVFPERPVAPADHSVAVTSAVVVVVMVVVVMVEDYGQPVLQSFESPLFLRLLVGSVDRWFRQAAAAAERPEWKLSPMLGRHCSALTRCV